MAAMTLGGGSAPLHLPVVATSNDGVLPLDLLYEILLRLPTVPLRCFRAVCRSWRSLLCHPDFIAAAHNPGPVLVVGVTDFSYSDEINVMDTESGDVVKQVNLASNIFPYAQVRSMNHDRVVCVVNPSNRVRLLDLANGAVCHLPNPLPPHQPTATQWCMLGRAASTGEQKVLSIAKYQDPQVCKILTLGNDPDWRDTGHPPEKAECQARTFAVVNGFVYFLSDYRVLHDHKIMVFDLNLEVWLPATSLRAPLKRRCDSLAELNGHLVAGYCIRGTTTIELWFLVDLDRSHWSKQYTMTIPCYQNLFTETTCYLTSVKPLAVLDDGRIVMWMRVFAAGVWTEVRNEVLSIYDPRTKTYTDGRKLPICSSVSVFTWNLIRSGPRSAIDMVAERLLMGRRRHGSK